MVTVVLIFVCYSILFFNVDDDIGIAIKCDLFIQEEGCGEGFQPSCLHFLRKVKKQKIVFLGIWRSLFVTNQQLDGIYHLPLFIIIYKHSQFREHNHQKSQSQKIK